MYIWPSPRGPRTQFEFAVNLKIASSLGLVIPKPVLLLADEVTE
jgi:hypothetical protein